MICIQLTVEDPRAMFTAIDCKDNLPWFGLPFENLFWTCFSHSILGCDKGCDIIMNGHERGACAWRKARVTSHRTLGLISKWSEMKVQTYATLLTIVGPWAPTCSRLRPFTWNHNNVGSCWHLLRIISAIWQNILYFDKTKSLFGKTAQPYTILLIPLKFFDKQTNGWSHTTNPRKSFW